MDKKWAALVPQQRLITNSGKPLRSLKPSRLIGRLPEEAYLLLYYHLPIADTVSLSRTCRKVAALAKDERVWKGKLADLDWRGPKPGEEGGIPRGEGASNPSTSSSGRPKSQSISSTTSTLPTAPASSLSSSTSHRQSLSARPQAAQQQIVEEDGFGDFVDFSNDGLDTFVSITDFDSVPIQPTPSQQARKKKQEEDLLMFFDDEEDAQNGADTDVGLSMATPQKRAVRNGQRPSVGDQNGRHFGTPAPSYDLFVLYFQALLPFYLSLKAQTTSSLVFTQAGLSPFARGCLLSNLSKFLQPRVAPSRARSTNEIVRRNLASASDYFESAMLAGFEKSSQKNDEEGMKLHARAVWELNGGGSVIHAFLDKIPLFYDQSWDPLQNLTKTMNPQTGELVDGIDFAAMDAFINHVLQIVEREGTVVARVFPQDSDVLLYFAEKIAFDVISEYIVPILTQTADLPPPLHQLACAATFGQSLRLIPSLLSIEPKSSKVTPSAVQDIILRMFEPHMAPFLSREASWIREVLEKVCSEWDSNLREQAENHRAMQEDPQFLNSQNPQQVKKNVLAGFTKALLLPVTIVPKTVAYSVNAITYGGTVAFNTMTGLGGNAVSTLGSPTEEKTQVLAGAPRSRESTAGSNGIGKRYSNGNGRSGIKREQSFQMLLSIDVAMAMIQADRDCLKRIQTFEGYTGQYGKRVRKAVEDVFIVLCQTLSTRHIQPAFAKATSQMSLYKPTASSIDESVAPLVQFFELVHIGDTIAQMVQVYYDRELASYVDRNDFLSPVVREKKKFDNTLDESVAAGLNAGVHILMSQAEFTLNTMQDPRDFTPDEGDDAGSNGTGASGSRRGSAPAMQRVSSSSSGTSASGRRRSSAVLNMEGPTQAAQAVVECLKSHCDMLRGSTDKAILEVFHQEVGLRLHGILLKHLSKSIVSIAGGFQVIADLNLYTSFVNTLKTPAVAPYFQALKMAANVFIIDSPKDLGLMARDLDRYQGTLRIEDIMEMVRCRTDWKRIEREVEKEVFGFKAEDCTIQ